MKTGYIALVGRPNVGKSTLLNHLVGQKISIISRRPQTTRHRILGIHTTPEAQYVYVDTPGIHDSEKRAMNRYLNRTAVSSLLGVDVVVWLVDRAEWIQEDALVVKRLHEAGLPVILAINKVDRLEDKSELLPFMEQAHKTYPFVDIVPVSALRGINLETLEQVIRQHLPEQDAIYPEDQITDRPERFFAAEIIREKLLHRLSQELPHALTVQIELFRNERHMTRIHATIWVERESQKPIVVGKGGQVLKRVGEEARHDLEQLLERKVFINLWVKVKDGWSDNERTLQGLGYHDGP
ncbi:MAG: GTP-binding protein Era [Pseudomonadota bacterium]